MINIIKIELQKMKKFKPDYRYYAKLKKTTLVKFALILHGIDPDIYSAKALDRALMFNTNGGKLLQPEDVYVPSVFQKILQKAYKTYMILHSVDWSKKYGDGRVYLRCYGLPMLWMVAEAKEKKLTIPTDFLKYFHENCLDGNVASSSVINKPADVRTLFHEKLNALSINNVRGNRKQVITDGIKLVLEATRNVDQNFDSSKMPGNVDDFHKFCLSLSNIFPTGKDNFHNHCKSKKSSIAPLCAWQTPAYSDKAFWTKIKDKLKL